MLLDGGRHRRQVRWRVEQQTRCRPGGLGATDALPGKGLVIFDPPQHGALDPGGMRSRESNRKERRRFPPVPPMVEGDHRACVQHLPIIVNIAGERFEGGRLGEVAEIGEPDEEAANDPVRCRQSSPQPGDRCRRTLDEPR